MRPLLRGAVVVFLFLVLFAVLSRSRDPRVTGLIAQGRRCIDCDDFTGAVAAFDEAVRIDPQNVDVLVQRGHALRLEDQNDRAMADFQEAIRRDPGNSEAYRGRGAIRADRGVFKSAFADCDEAIRSNPRNGAAFRTRGWIYAMHGEVDKAIRDFNRAIRLDPRDAWAYADRGDAMWRKSRMDAALADYNVAIALLPQAPSICISRAQFWANKKEFGNAIDDLTVAIRGKPTEADYFDRRAGLYEQMQCLDMALADINEAIRLDSGHADYFACRARIYLLLGQRDKAVGDCNAALRLDPKNLYAMEARGYVDLLLGENEKAVQDESEAIRRDPNARDAYENRGQAFERLGRLDAALDDLDSAMVLGRKDDRLYVERARLYYKKERYGRAVEDLTEAIRRSPEADTYYERSLAYAALHHVDKALADCGEAIRLNAGNWHYWRQRALLYAEKGDRAAAKADFDRSRPFALAELVHEFKLSSANRRPALAAELERRIAEQVKALEYDGKVAKDLASMVGPWCLTGLSQRLADAREAHAQGRLSLPELVTVELRTAEELARLIEAAVRPIGPGADGDLERGHELTDVVYEQDGCCQSEALLYFALGRAIGLQVQGLDVAMIEGGANSDDFTHAACLVHLADGSAAIADATANLAQGALVSPAFRFEDVYRRFGNYWKLADEKNPLGLHRIVRPEGVDALVAEIYAYRAGKSLSHGDNNAADASIVVALRHDSDCANALAQRASRRDRSGRPNGAIADCSREIELNPGNVAARCYRGTCEIETHELDRALADFDEALVLNPKSSNALMGRGEARARRGQLTEAKADLDKAISADRQSAYAYLWRGYVVQLMAARDQDASSPLAPITVPRTFASSVEVGSLTTDSSSILANELAQSTVQISAPVIPVYPSEYWRAKADFDEAIRLAPNWASAYACRGALFALLGERGSALDDFTTAIRLDGKDADVFERRAKLFAHRGDLDKAIADFGKAIELNPKSADDYTARGDLYSRKNDKAKAAADYAKAKELGETETDR